MPSAQIKNNKPEKQQNAFGKNPQNKNGRWGSANKKKSVDQSTRRRPRAMLWGEVFTLLSAPGLPQFASEIPHQPLEDSHGRPPRGVPSVGMKICPKRGSCQQDAPASLAFGGFLYSPSTVPQPHAVS